MSIRVIALVLAATLLLVSRATATHEKFIVGAMRNVDPSAELVMSISGKCVPTHDRERLDCDFTAFRLRKTLDEESGRKQKKEFDDLVQEMKRDPSKRIEEFKKSFCDKKMPEPDPLSMKYQTSYRTMMTSMTAFCQRQTSDSLLNFFRIMMESAAKTCHIRVIDWKSTFLRKGDRWVATEGPSKLCGAVRIFTLIPHDVNKMKESLGPGLWTFQGKVVVTDEAADPVCADPKTMPLIANLVDGAMSVSWNAPRKTVECSEFEFFSALEKDLLFK